MFILSTALVCGALLAADDPAKAQVQPPAVVSDGPAPLPPVRPRERPSPAPSVTEEPARGKRAPRTRSAPVSEPPVPAAVPVRRVDAVRPAPPGGAMELAPPPGERVEPAHGRSILVPDPAIFRGVILPLLIAVAGGWLLARIWRSG